MEKIDVIKFIKAQIDTEMTKLKDAKDDDMYAQGKSLLTQTSQECFWRLAWPIM